MSSDRLHLQGRVNLRTERDGSATDKYFLVFELYPRVGSSDPSRDDIKFEVPVTEDVYRTMEKRLYGKGSKSAGHYLFVDGSLEIAVS